MASSGKATLDEIWVPRIGEEAAVELRRNGYLTLVVGPTVLGLAIFCSFAFGKGTSLGSALGVLAVLIALTLCVVWTRSRLRFAKALSNWFGTRISIQGLPRMTASQFDAWCQRRHLSRASD